MNNHFPLRNEWQQAKHTSVWEIGCTQLLIGEPQNSAQALPKSPVDEKGLKRNYGTRVMEGAKRRFRIREPISAKPEIRHDILEFPTDSRDKKTLKHNYEDRIIVGAIIESHGKDERARWKLTEGGIGQANNGLLGIQFLTEKRKLVLGGPNVLVDIQTQKIENAFKVEVWSVDREIYAQ
jgi:hypothetical protein